MEKAKKILNDPKNVVPELLEGQVLAYHGKVKKLAGVNALVKTQLPKGKVGLLIGGLLKKAQMSSLIVILVLSAGMAASVSAQDMTFENDRFQIVLGADGKWKCILEKALMRQLCPKADTPFAEVPRIGFCTGLKMRGPNLEADFAGKTQVMYGVSKSPDWLRFEIVQVLGERPRNITFCQVPVNITENVGPMLNIAWDDKTSVCLMGTDLAAECRGRESRGHALLTAGAQDGPGPALEGTGAALIVCRTPDIRPILRSVPHAFGLLTNEDAHGVPSRETLGKRSYWFLGGIKESDADRIIELCNKTSIRQVLLSFGTWARCVGHYSYNTKNFPDGLESLKRFCKKLNDAGVGVGCHTFVSKVAKADSYVTPVPDKRFWVDRETTLAADIGPDDTSIKAGSALKEWPGSPAASQKTWEGGVRNHQDVIIGDEIIQYAAIGPPGTYGTFIGCKRGAYGTGKAAHKAGSRSVHWGVDGGINGYIIDPESTLLDEVTDRMAKIFNECGFNQIYFDGGEDVPRTRLDYYTALSELKTVSKIKKRPYSHLSMCYSQRLWHSATIGFAADTYLNTLSGAFIAGSNVEKWPTVKQHVDRSVRWVMAARKSLYQGELGWFGIWPASHRAGKTIDGLQLDEAEYLMVKSLAYDAPISLETSFGEMSSHPLTPAILDIVSAYERMRREQTVDKNTIQRLAELDKDFAYITIEADREFVEMTELSTVAGAHDIRSFLGTLKNGSPVATIWHHTGNPVKVSIESRGQIEAVALLGKTVTLERTGDAVTIPVGAERLAIIFRHISARQAAKALADARLL